MNTCALAKATSKRSQFSNWTKWEDRDDVAFSNERNGVYALAYFADRLPSKRPNLLDQNILYFGETCKQTLRDRWNQFERASEGKRGHSGGKSFRKWFKGKELSSSKAVSRLFVGALPVGDPEEKDDYVRDREFALIKYKERKLILDYVKKWKELPACNTE